jgi:hypothetical protein
MRTMLTVSSTFSEANFQPLFSRPSRDQQQFCTLVFQQFRALHWGEAKSIILPTFSTTLSKSIIDEPVRIVCAFVRGKPDTLTSRNGCKWVFDLDYE